ncbi:MAG: hypothetical protein LBJ20_07565 [Candidatus Methanoplasma sp.]|jgi:hypothetical protein|nr:hypothetical protein [Candidatus Methanoplasma sp.]
MEFSVINTVTWAGIIVSILFGILGYKYQAGIRDGVVKLGRRIAVYFAIFLVAAVAVLMMLILIEDSWRWPINTILMTVAIGLFDVFLFREARPNAVRVPKNKPL